MKYLVPLLILSLIFLQQIACLLLSKLLFSTVDHLLGKINNNKAIGLYGIPGKLLNMAASMLSSSLTQMLKKSPIKRIYSKDWKMAKVLTIFKNGRKFHLSNYRPISIISSVAKVFGRFANNQFYSYLIITFIGLLSHHLSGFRASYSTVISLLATNHWCINIDNGLLNAVIFVELKKAFDSTDHKILLQKLRCYGVNDSALMCFSSYLTDRKQKCFVNGKLSKSHLISYGVLQDSIIGPLLSLIYINDLPNCLSERVYQECILMIQTLAQKINNISEICRVQPLKRKSIFL